MPEPYDQPFKLRALTALTDAIKTITPANGYVMDLADDVDEDALHPERVFRGRAWFGDSDPLPMVSVLEGTSPADDVGEPPVDTTTGEYDWAIMVQGFIKDDPTHPTDPAYHFLADVRRRLAVERTRKAAGSNQPDPFGMGRGRNRITSIKIGPGVVRPADDVSAVCYFWLTVILRVVDNASEPYA